MRIHFSHEPVRLSCAEFLNARRIESVWNAPNFDMNFRWHYIILMAEEGQTRKRLWTIHRQYNFGEPICYLHPVTVVVTPDAEIAPPVCYCDPFCIHDRDTKGCLHAR